MEHLDFVDKLNETGVSIRGTDVEGREKKFVIYGIFGNSNTIIQKDGRLRWENRDERSAFAEIVKLAIDIDQWKHSWHNEIKPENYNKFRDIIQEKILERAEQIETLLTIYFQIGHEMTD
jgi:hypothetical protein